jgi:hypothetical protein
VLQRRFRSSPARTPRTELTRASELPLPVASLTTSSGFWAGYPCLASRAFCTFNRSRPGRKCGRRFQRQCSHDEQRLRRSNPVSTPRTGRIAARNPASHARARDRRLCAVTKAPNQQCFGPVPDGLLPCGARSCLVGTAPLFCDRLKIVVLMQHPATTWHGIGISPKKSALACLFCFTVWPRRRTLP